MFIYFEKNAKFCEISTLLAIHRTKVRLRFHKTLWPSQNIWTLTYHKATMRSRTSLMSLTPVSSCVTEICRSASSAWACKALSPSMISTLGISSASNDKTQFSKWTSNQDSNESMTWLSTTRKNKKMLICSKNSFNSRDSKLFHLHENVKHELPTKIQTNLWLDCRLQENTKNNC